MSFTTLGRSLAFAGFLLGTAAWTQSLPTGVIGAVPAAQRATVKYVRYFGLTVPVNGLGNYVFYYTPQNPQSNWQVQSTFLASGGGAVEYLDSERNFVSVANANVSYNPTSAFTETVEVPGHKFNTTGGTGGPPGIFGFVTSDGSPRSGVTVRLYKLANNSWSQVDEVKTNANGFYVFYYTGSTNKEFLTSGTYNVGLLCSGYQYTIPYQPTEPGYVDGSVNISISIPAGSCGY